MSKSSNIIATAQCGDLFISFARIYQSERFALRGMQREDGDMVIIFDREFTDEIEGLVAFADAIKS